MSRQGVSELLSHINGIRNKKQRVEALRSAAQQFPGLLIILSGAYDAGVVWELPPGEVPYRPQDIPDQENILWSEIRRLYIFCRGGSNINQLRREAQFIQLLEAVMPHDAKLLIAMKDKSLPYKNIGIDVVRQAFPDLLPDVDPVTPEELPVKKKTSSPVRGPIYAALDRDPDAPPGNDPLTIFEN